VPRQVPTSQIVGGWGAAPAKPLLVGASGRIIKGGLRPGEEGDSTNLYVGNLSPLMNETGSVPRCHNVTIVLRTPLHQALVLDFFFFL
jgi:hypothetical protein